MFGKFRAPKAGMLGENDANPEGSGTFLIFSEETTVKVEVEFNQAEGSFYKVYKTGYIFL